MKLKTLNDLKNLDLPIHGADLYGFAEVIKCEAIKWIKEEITFKINEKLPATDFQIQKIGFNIINCKEIKRWMDRFNIIDEDLK